MSDKGDNDKGLIELGGYLDLPARKIITDPNVGEIKLLIGDRADNETSKNVMWCNEFLRMGIKRSISNLFYVMHQEYSMTSIDVDNGASDTLPTLHTIRKWSKLFEWDKRAEVYDNISENHRQRQMFQVAQSELIHSWGRVLKLIELEKVLSEVLAKKGADGDHVNLWIHHKGSRTFNSALIQQYRGLLDDVSKEVGGRNKVDSPEVMFSSPENSMPTVDPSTLSDEELKQFVELLEKANVEEHEDIVIDAEEDYDGQG